MPGGHSHRSGSLRQSNKKNKRSKSSKRSVTRSAGGKVNRRVDTIQQALAQSKADRRHMAQQKRDAKRQELLRRKRGVDGGPAPSRIIGIISLGETEEIELKLRSAILKGSNRVIHTYGNDNQATVTAKFDAYKKEGSLTLLTNSTAFRNHYGKEDGAVMGALDLCRVCDMVVFLIDADGVKPEDNLCEMQIGGESKSVTTSKSSATQQDWDHLISERGDRVLAAVKSQGLPTPLTVLAYTEKDAMGDDMMSIKSAKSIRRGNLKRHLEQRKYISRFATTEFGVDNDKFMEIDLTEEDSVEMDVAENSTGPAYPEALVRTLCQKSATATKWVANAARSYILSDFHSYDSEKEELKITGYIRGLVPHNVNALVHVPNMGTYACKSVEKALNPLARAPNDGNTNMQVLKSDPSLRESLNMFATPNALDGEQNLIGFEEEEDEEILDAADKEDKFSRPAGWSDYQSAWLDAVDDMDTHAGDVMDHGELADELNKKSKGDGLDMEGANEISAEERQNLIEQRRKDQNDELEFPDEVQVDEDEKASERFARYRSIKSFRKSYWDPKENLPDTFAEVFHFSSFKATQRSVMQEMQDSSKVAESVQGKFWGATTSDLMKDTAMVSDSEDDEDLLLGCIPSGSYVTLTIEGVSSKNADKVLKDNLLLTAVALLPHENKMSVLHAGLSRTSDDNIADIPIKSKDLLTFRCGWRTWQGRPVFSQNNLNCDKHKFERFMPPKGAFFAATFFGPVTYAPCPVLVFRNTEEEGSQLICSGSMMSADADRIVVKRVILTGYPVRVHKRHATVKYMFYNPDDVKWFKPAGLWTKHGLHGNITESVGEHGTMKCLFNAPIKQHDTVCLPLYKRIFPKFPQADVEDLAQDDISRATSRRRNVLIVR